MVVGDTAISVPAAAAAASRRDRRRWASTPYCDGESSSSLPPFVLNEAHRMKGGGAAPMTRCVQVPPQEAKRRIMVVVVVVVVWLGATELSGADQSPSYGASTGRPNGSKQPSIRRGVDTRSLHVPLEEFLVIARKQTNRFSSLATRLSQQVHSKSTRNSFTQTPVVLLTTGRGRIFTVEHMKQITVERSLRANLGPGPSVKNAALTANLHLRWTANTSVAIEGVVIYSTGGILFA